MRLSHCCVMRLSLPMLKIGAMTLSRALLGKAFSIFSTTFDA